MAKKELKYKIVEAGTGGPPQSSPVLADEDGNILPPDQPLIFNKSSYNMRKVDHFRIKFEIDDFPNARLRFTSNTNDVMWAQKGTDNTSCPTTACYMPGVFWVDDEPPPHPGGKWIEVINMDMVSEDFWFTLNLVDKNNPTSTSYVPVDPGGVNQNAGGSGSGFTSSALISVALGVCAGVVAFFGAQLFFT